MVSLGLAPHKPSTLPPAPAPSCMPSLTWPVLLLATCLLLATSLGLVASCIMVARTGGVPSQPEESSCTICKALATQLDAMIIDNTNEQEIKDALERLCFSLPTSLEKQCEGVIEMYMDKLVEEILEDLNPDRICRVLGFCHPLGRKQELAHCSWRDAAKCIGEIKDAFKQCKHAHKTEDILTCIKDILGAGDCWGCVCTVLPFLCG